MPRYLSAVRIESHRPVGISSSRSAIRALLITVLCRLGDLRDERSPEELTFRRRCCEAANSDCPDQDVDGETTPMVFVGQ